MTALAPTTMQTWHFDKLAGVPEGPWTGEPDKAQWVDAATNLDCLIVRGPLGALCGYVGVPFEHPLHGADAGDVLFLDVAHGVNYSDLCDDRMMPDGICHVPAAGRPANVWWFGFDNGLVLRDVVPLHDHMMAELRRTTPVFAEMPPMPEPPEWLRATYKPLPYVIAQCESLAAQLVDFKLARHADSDA